MSEGEGVNGLQNCLVGVTAHVPMLCLVRTLGSKSDDVGPCGQECDKETWGKENRHWCRP